MNIDKSIIPLEAKPANCQSCGGTFRPHNRRDLECDECTRWRRIGEHLSALKRLFHLLSVVPSGNLTTKSLKQHCSHVSSDDVRWSK